MPGPSAMRPWDLARITDVRLKRRDRNVDGWLQRPTAPPFYSPPLPLPPCPAAPLPPKKTPINLRSRSSGPAIPDDLRPDSSDRVFRLSGCRPLPFFPFGRFARGEFNRLSILLHGSTVPTSASKFGRRFHPESDWSPDDPPDRPTKRPPRPHRRSDSPSPATPASLRFPGGG